MEYIIVGTAGHVDHGKTVLVKALTGVDTDRLKEEKERGISIELGFAPLTLPSGRRLGLVDVPGHERFIKQMLAGVGGMDLVLLVIAADEGIMPQTKEHLDIINLLQVKKGIIVITKIDLVEEEWLEMVEEDVREAVQGTILENAPIVAVSALTGQGMEKLVQVLDRLAAETPAKSTAGKARLPIDRVFSITGFGTVVTGTLWSGRIKVGELLDILPERKEVRVRNLQVHGSKVDEALAGQRVAVNLAGVDVEEIGRGSTLVEKNFLQPSRRLDVHLHLLASVPKALKHGSRVRIHLGTSENLGRIQLLDREELKAGETAFVQLVIEEPLVADKNDRLVIRSYSPMHTIGGGVVVNPVASKHKRFNPEVLQTLATRLRGTPEELVLEALKGAKGQPLSEEELGQQAGLSAQEVVQTITGLADTGKVCSIVIDGKPFFIITDALEKHLEDVGVILEEYQQRFPLRPGMPKEELRSRKFNNMPVKIFQALLDYWASAKRIKLVGGNFVATSQFEPSPSPAQQQLMNKIEELYRAGMYQPPGWKEVQEQVGLKEPGAEELMSFMVRQGKLVKLAEDIYLHRQALDSAKTQIANLLAEKGEIQLAEVRDLLNSSRKYILPLLEYLDQIKFTKRVGDKRVLY